MDTTDALNLWDIETRIKELHEELEILHQTKEELMNKGKDSLRFIHGYEDLPTRD